MAAHCAVTDAVLSLFCNDGFIISLQHARRSSSREIVKKRNGRDPDVENAASLSQEVQEGEKEKKDEDKEKEKKKEAEPNFQLLENPARVMPAQLKVLIMPESCRYQPFKPVSASHILRRRCSNRHVCRTS